MLEKAKDWVASLIAGNGFGDDFTDAEIEEWARDLIDTFGLPCE